MADSPTHKKTLDSFQHFPSSSSTSLTVGKSAKLWRKSNLSCLQKAFWPIEISYKYLKKKEGGILYHTHKNEKKEETPKKK